MLSRGGTSRSRLPRAGSVAAKRLLGIIVLAGACAFIVLAVTRPSPFSQARTFLAEFDSAQGIGRVDRDIRVAGTNVGHIGEVTRVDDDVVVELVIENDLRIGDDARAELRPHTLFEGSAFIDLHPGSPSAPSLKDGATIERSRTEVYVSLDEALRVLHKPTREALRDLAETGAATLRPQAIDGLQRTLAAAPELTANTGPVMRALRGPEGDELAGAIQGLAKTTRAVASRESDLLPIAQRARATFGALNVDGGAPLDAAFEALPGVLEQLDAGGARLLAVIDRLDTLAVDLQPALEQLLPLLQELQPVLRAGTPILLQAPPLIADLRTVLRRIAAAAPQFLALVEEIKPGARLLDEEVLPFLNADSRLGLPAYLQLISAFTAADAALRPYQTEAQGPLGEGHALRLGAYFDPNYFSGGSPFPRRAREAIR
ncbi:MAG: MlaD family protein [Solirubrobacterales bacterium]